MTRRKIYLASSWRNPYQPEYVKGMRSLGHLVYDFRNPSSEPSIGPNLPDGGFSWADISPDWESWSDIEYATALMHPVARAGFAADAAALKWCDTGVLLLPSGRSAHLEAGQMIGEGKPVAVILDADEVIPELMYLLARAVLTENDEIGTWLAGLPATSYAPPYRI